MLSQTPTSFGPNFMYKKIQALALILKKISSFIIIWILQNLGFKLMRTYL